MREIVKFENGNYGVRVKRGGIFTEDEFLDMQDPQFSWKVGSGFDNCIQGSKEECERFLLNVKEVVTPTKSPSK